MEAADVLKFPDLKLSLDKEYKRILVDIFAKATFYIHTSQHLFS